MYALALEKLRPLAAKNVRPFLEDVLSSHRDGIHSIYITGSSITDDFDEKTSDVNSVIVLKEMDLKFIETLARSGRKYRKHRVAAPLIMTPEYIRTSLDVFPVEFLNFRLSHATVYGEDILDGLDIRRTDLRHQCEREIKTKLISLRQGYIASAGDRKIITEGLARSITGHVPLFRGILYLLGKQPPVRQKDVISMISETADLNSGIFLKVLRVKQEKLRPGIQELNTIFEDYYAATVKLGKIIDEISA